MPILNEKKLSFFRWLEIPIEERQPSTFKEKARELHVTPQTVNNWQKEYPAYLEKQVGHVIGGKYNSQEWLKERSSEADIALLKAIVRGNAMAIKLFKQLTGELVEKAELKIDLISAEQLAREHIETRRWLNEHGYVEEAGMAKVQSEPSLLPEKLRDDPPSDKGDNPI